MSCHLEFEPMKAAICLPDHEPRCSPVTILCLLVGKCERTGVSLVLDEAVTPRSAWCARMGDRDGRPWCSRAMLGCPQKTLTLGENSVTLIRLSDDPPATRFPRASLRSSRRGTHKNSQLFALVDISHEASNAPA